LLYHAGLTTNASPQHLVAFSLQLACVTLVYGIFHFEFKHL